MSKLAQYRVSFQLVWNKQLYNLENTLTATSHKQATYITVETFKKKYKADSFKIVSKVKVVEDGLPDIIITEVGNVTHLKVEKVQENKDKNILRIYEVTVYALADSTKYECNDTVSAYTAKQARFQVYKRIQRKLEVEGFKFYKPTETKCIREGVSGHILDVNMKNLKIDID